MYYLILEALESKDTSCVESVSTPWGLVFPKVYDPGDVSVSKFSHEFLKFEHEPLALATDA